MVATFPDRVQNVRIVSRIPEAAYDLTPELSVTAGYHNSHVTSLPCGQLARALRTPDYRVRMIDEYLSHLLDIIDKHGWAVQSVLGGEEPDEAPYSYTVGLTTLGDPEFVITGMPARPAQQLLNILGTEVKAGRRYHANTLTSDPTETAAPVALIAVPDPSPLLAALNFYGEIEVLQVIWPDSSGRLPWVRGYPNPPEAQPFWGTVPDTFTMSSPSQTSPSQSPPSR
jgi:Domain of unknown function (DUF4262)